MTMTYTEIYNAVVVLWPNVTNIDLFLEKLTDEQIALITKYVNRRNDLTYAA
jgi:hypothetical protein